MHIKEDAKEIFVPEEYFFTWVRNTYVDVKKLDSYMHNMAFYPKHHTCAFASDS